MENGGFWERRAITTKSRTPPQKLVDPTQTQKTPKNSMNSTELHSKTDIRQGESTRTSEKAQAKKNRKIAFVTFPAGSPITNWPAEQHVTNPDLPNRPDDAKLKQGENADNMNFVSKFVTAAPQFSHPENDDVIDRIEQIEQRFKLNHSEVAKEIGISRGTVHAILKGRKGTPKLIRKLEAAEKRLEASTLQPTVSIQSMLVFAMNSAFPEETPTAPNQVFVRPKGGDGNTYPDGTIITLTAPPVIKGIGAIVRAHAEDRCNDLIKSCLPQEFANDQWIENMSPTSYLWALQKSVILILGPNWKLELTRILANAEAQKPKTTLNTEKPLEIKK
jgi:DNA-binding XRE family transcriptional regulator